MQKYLSNYRIIKTVVSWQRKSKTSHRVFLKNGAGNIVLISSVHELGHLGVNRVIDLDSRGIEVILARTDQ